jgi:hypothetical protein
MTGERDIQGPHGSLPAADPPFRFGLGVFGLAILTLIVLRLLRDPVWENE